MFRVEHRIAHYEAGVKLVDVANNHHFATLQCLFTHPIVEIIGNYLSGLKCHSRVAEPTLLTVFIHIRPADGKTDNPSKDIFSEVLRPHIAQGRARLNWCLSKS